jgi:hypothetical protein
MARDLLSRTIAMRASLALPIGGQCTCPRRKAHPFQGIESGNNKMLQA